MIDGGVASTAAYDNAYVQEGLVALYTAFSANDPTVDVVNGVWANKIKGGFDATIKGNGYFWRMNPNGGLTYEMTEAYWNNNGAARLSGVALDDSYAALASFTVESIQKLHGIKENYTGEYLVCPGQTPAHTDKNGVNIPAVGEMYGYYKTNHTTHRIGLLNAFTWATTRVKNDTNSLGNYRWFISNAMYSSHTSVENDIMKMVGTDSTIFNRGLPLTTEQYVKSADASGNVTYKILHDGVQGIAKTFDKATYDKIAAVAYNDPMEKFSLFNASPTTVYAIRVYNRVLSADEMRHNHFVDLLAYHGIAPAVVEKMTDEQFAQGAVHFAEYGLDQASKEAVENFLAGIRTVTFIVDGEVVHEENVALGTFATLGAARVGDKIAVAWELNGTVVALGATVDVTDDTTFTAITISAPKTVNGASVKAVRNSAALRFTATINVDEYDALVALLGEDSVKHGMIISTQDHIKKAGAFTHAALGKAVLDFEMTGCWRKTDDSYVLAASVKNFSDSTIANNYKFNAVAYVALDVDGDGTFETYVYGDYDEACARDPKSVLNAVLADPTNGFSDEELGWIITWKGYFDKGTKG